MTVSLVIAKTRLDPISNEELEHFSTDVRRFWMETIHSMLTTVGFSPEEDKNLCKIMAFYHLKAKSLVSSSGEEGKTLFPWL